MPPEQAHFKEVMLERFGVKETTIAIVRLLRWDKPAGRLLLMIPALWAVVLASGGVPAWDLVIIIILGAIATSGAGCIVNDLWDRDIDPHVERTKNRPLASRQLTVRVAVALLLLLLLCAWLAVAWLNPVSIALAVAAVPVIVLYPAAKRVFPVPQLVLAIAWGFAVLISWTAVAGRSDTVWINETTLWLWGATVLWTLGFDTVYALSDRLDDERLGVKSSARFFGRRTPIAIGLFYLGAAICLVGVGLSASLGGLYWLSWLSTLSLWVWQTQQLRQVNRPPCLYPAIFRQNVWQGFILLAGMIGGLVLAN